MRIAVAHQVVDDVVAHDHILGGVLFVGRRKAAAEGNVDVVQRHHASRCSRARRCCCWSGRCRPRWWTWTASAPTSLQSVAAILDGLVVLDADDLALLIFEVLFGGKNHAGHAGHREDVRAVAGELGGDVSLGALHQGEHHDDRGHAHHHADQREDGAQLVAPKGLEARV